MADLNQYRRGPLRNDQDVQIAIQEIADKLNEIVAATNILRNKQLVWVDIDETPTTLEGYGITDAASLHHTHPISDVIGLQAELDELAAGSGGDGGTVDWDDVTDKPTTFPPSPHNHDDRYYTQAEDDALLAGKAALVHNHDDRYYKKDQSDALLLGKVNRDGGDYLDGFAEQPFVLTYDLPILDNHIVRAVGPFDVAAILDVAGVFEVVD